MKVYIIRHHQSSILYYHDIIKIRTQYEVISEILYPFDVILWSISENMTLFLYINIDIFRLIYICNFSILSYTFLENVEQTIKIILAKL